MSRWAVIEHHESLLAKETGTVIREPGGRIKVALIYPNTYQVGMANLGMAVIYRQLNGRGDVHCERVFLPDRESQPLYEKTGSGLVSLESSRPVAEFDLVLASISFENDAPNLAAMLEHAGLGLWSADREGPLVIAGGVVPMLNPEPLSGIVDGFLLGEAEEVLESLVDKLLPCLDLPREEALLTLAQEVPGFYAPRFYQAGYDDNGLLSSFSPTEDVPEKIVVSRYAGPDSGLARSVVNAAGPQFGDMHLIEVGRGCGHGCRFCAAGHVFRPPRLGRSEDFRQAALDAAAQGGKVGLVSAAVSDLPGVGSLARAVVEAGGFISVSSLRADRLTPELARALAKSNLQSVALAPEAGSERLRRIINKRLTEDELARAVEILINAGVPNIKFYFMVGLPGETEGDIEELIALVKRIRQQVVSLSRIKGRLGRLSVSLNAFVPKPWTPFQWEPMLGLKAIKKRMEKIKRSLNRLANLKVTTDVPKYAVLQAALSRGDRRLAPLIAALAKDPAPQRAWKATGLDPKFYAHRRRDKDELLPWSFLDHGIKPQYLWAEAQRALKEKESPPCDVEKCKRCGVC